MNRQIRLFVFVTLLVAITLPASYATEQDPRPAWDSYSEFGFTLKYPPELNLKAADTATAEEGSISSIKPREIGKLLHLRWMRGISGKQSIAEKVLRPYIRSCALQFAQLGEVKVYLGESKWLKVHNQQTAFARFCTSDEKGYFLNVLYAWYAEDSNRTFVLCCGAVWEHPEMITNGSRFMVEWPKLDDDPSYGFSQNVLKSFEDKLKQILKHSERGYSLSVKGTVAKEPYPSWASLTSKSMAYLVQAEVRNTDERSFCFDCVKAAFRPASGTPLVISNRTRDPDTQETLETILSSGQDKQWQFGTDGYTEGLLAKAGGKPLEFSLTFLLKDEVVDGPYFTTLPHIRELPISVGTTSIGGKKSSLAFSKSLKSAPAQIRHSSKTTDGQDWIKLASLTGGKEMKQSDSFGITTGEAKIRYTLTGERAVDGELNQTSIMLFRKGLTMAESARKGREGANIFPMKMVSGSGSDEYIEKVEPGTYSIYACSPAGASWTVQVYEKRNPLEAPPKESVSLQEELYKQSKIAFFSERDGNYEIYVINADGSEQKRLTNNPADDLLPSWSPDGKRIAFVSKRDGNPEIYIMNTDGSEQINLTNNPAEDAEPSWSPDGKKIAFYSTRDGNYEIYVMNVDGSELKRLTNNPRPDLASSWSPDGKKIAFNSKRDGNTEIYVINADGSELKRLTNNPAGSTFPSWSPDGRKIAFESRRDGKPDVYVMNTDGSDQKRLTNNPAVDGSPAWSPDGRKIAFMSKRDGNYEIYVMNTDGTEQKRLTNNPAEDGFPSWSPFLGSEESASALGVVKGPPDANEQGAKNCLKIKYLDLSERLIYDWSFRYFYLEYDSPPPKGYWYSLHGRENEKEKMSHTLYLINEGRRVQVLSDQIDRFRMKWKKRKISSQREEGNLERTSLLLLTIDGRTFELDYKTNKYWKKDISSFADKDKYHTNIHLYIVGKERKNDQLIDYSLNLGYDRSILFGHDPSKIPVEIAVIKTESGAPTRLEISYR